MPQKRGIPGQLRRLTAGMARRLGLAPSSRRAVTEADFAALEAIERGESTISDTQNFVRSIQSFSNRQLQNSINFVEFGSFVSKEEKTRRIRSGRASYRTPGAARTQELKPEYRRIRSAIPDVSKKDMQIIAKKHEQGYESLTKGEQKRFHQLFDKYKRKVVLEALGSPETK